jgi:hypothetical protein
VATVVEIAAGRDSASVAVVEAAGLAVTVSPLLRQWQRAAPASPFFFLVRVAFRYLGVFPQQDRVGLPHRVDITIRVEAGGLAQRC